MNANLTLDTWRNAATIAAAAIGLAVYVTNSFQHRRQRSIENALRFVSVHRGLADLPFIKKNLHALSQGDFQRDTMDEPSKIEFSRFLLELEYFALLAREGAISQTLVIYMFGWYAQRIQPLITENDRKNVYWEVAVKFLDNVKRDADDFCNKTPTERDCYHRRKHFGH